MEPIAVWVRRGGEWAVIHRCRRCGALLPSPWNSTRTPKRSASEVFSRMVSDRSISSPARSEMVWRTRWRRLEVADTATPGLPVRGSAFGI